MAHDYRLLGIVLDGGSWAEWFAGGMSLLAVITALSGYLISDLYRRRDERRRDLTASESAAWRVVQMLNYTQHIIGHIRESLKGVDRNTPWTFTQVRPLAVANYVLSDITADELSILIKAKSADLAMEISECIARYESVRYAMQEYKNRHEALFELLPTPIAGKGVHFEHALTREQSQRVLPYQRMLEALVDDMINLSAINIQKGNRLLDELPRRMEQHFGKWTLKLEIDESQRTQTEPI